MAACVSQRFTAETMRAGLIRTMAPYSKSIRLLILLAGAANVAYGCKADSHGQLTKCAPGCSENLQNNGIKSISARAWIGCPQLTNVRLGHNSLQRFPRAAFKAAANLRSIELHHNHIQYLDSADFASISHLTVADLSDNMISDLDSGLLQKSEVLQRLDLSFNNLSFIPREVAQGMRKILHVDLSNNPGIKGCTASLKGRCTFSPIRYKGSMPVSSFCVCGDILSESIQGSLQFTSAGPAADLSRRTIKRLEKDAFTSGQFAWVQAAHTGRHLAAIAKDAYVGSPGITSLNLYQSGITSIDALAFQGLSLLETLDIAYNQLDTLPAGVFAPLASIKSIDVSRNPGHRLCPYNTDRRCRFGSYGGDRFQTPFCFCFGDYNISAPQYTAAAVVLAAAEPAASKVSDLAGKPDEPIASTTSSCAQMSFCSGHGTCNNATSTCDCYEGWGAPSDSMLLRAPDCSHRACPSGVSWASMPTSVDDAHAKSRECSDRGMCMYATGLCECFEGFTGAACQRSACPRKCSGHGRCVTVTDLSIQDNAIPFVPAFSYDDGISKSAWDADKMQGCVCDSAWEAGLGDGQTQQTSWFGMDCSSRACPSGDDPSTTGEGHAFFNELNCQYFSSNGAVWEAAVSSDGTPCFHDPSGSTAECTLPAKYANTAAFLAASGVTYGAQGNLCYVPCSNRGECGSDGQCRCYPGYGGPACSKYTMLATG